MSAFYDGEFDILLSTAIVESGLDVPNANTMIVHRADHVRAGAALPAARARRALEDAGLCILHDATGQALDGSGREAPEGTQFARHAGRRVLAWRATISIYGWW